MKGGVYRHYNAIQMFPIHAEGLAKIPRCAVGGLAHAQRSKYLDKYLDITEKYYPVRIKNREITQYIAERKERNRKRRIIIT